MDVVASSMMKHIFTYRNRCFDCSSGTCATSLPVLPGKTTVTVKLELKARMSSKGKAKKTSPIWALFDDF